MVRACASARACAHARPWFAEVVLQSPDTWLVEYFAPWCGHCKALVPEWIKAAKQLKSSGVRVGAVDCDVEANKPLCGRYEVKGFPTILHFSEDKSAKKPAVYSGAREASAIVAYGQQAVGGSGGGLVAAVTYLSAHSFLHSGTASALLLTAEGSAQPAWLSSLAVKFKEGKRRSLLFGCASEPAVAARFGVAALPALLVIFPAAEGEGQRYLLHPQPLPSSAAAAVKELRGFLDSALAGGGVAEAQPLPAFPPSDVPRKQADVSYSQLSEDTLESACFGGKGVCVLALVHAPTGTWAQSHVLEEAARKYRNDPVQFAWLHAGSQPEFASAFDVDAADLDSLPALRLVKGGKRPRSARLVGPLNAASLAQLVDRALGGDLQFVAMPQGLPQLMPEAVRAALRDAEAEL